VVLLLTFIIIWLCRFKLETV